MSGVTDLLDTFYAGALGCSARELRAGHLVVVESDPRSIDFAKGSPLALYGLARGGGGAICVRPGHGAVLQRMLAERLPGSTGFDDSTCEAIEEGLSSHFNVAYWFRGIRLFCGPDSFVDHSIGEVREIGPREDEGAALLQSRWGGKVFGQIVRGKVVSRAAVKPLSDVIWDLSIETLPGERRRGYAKSTVSAALKHVFAHDRLAGWGCDRTAEASLRTAIAVGFREYALDFGCVEAVGEG